MYRINTDEVLVPYTDDGVQRWLLPHQLKMVSATPRVTDLHSTLTVLMFV